MSFLWKRDDQCRLLHVKFVSVVLVVDIEPVISAFGILESGLTILRT
jgi:hypothetical protein